MDLYLRENLPKIIKEKNLSVSAFERMAGLKKNAVTNIINGHTKNPSAKTLQSIADLVGCSVKDLLQNNEINSYTSLQRSTVSSPTSEVKVTYLEDIDLFNEISSYFTQCLKNKESKVDINNFLQSIVETYSFCYFKNDKKFDIRFADWSIEKIL